MTYAWHANELAISPDPEELARHPADSLGFAQLAPMPLWDRFTDFFQRALWNRKAPPRPAKIIETSERLTPPLLAGDNRAALPVLQALQNHASPKVRVFARFGIMKLLVGETKRVVRQPHAD